MLCFSDNPNRTRHDHITGHFRQKSSRIWDPHPQYEIEAFGLKLHLNLYRDDSHIHPDLKVSPFNLILKQSLQFPVRVHFHL